FSAQDQRADGALGRIVGHFQSAIARVARERMPARQSVTDRASERALGTDLTERSSKESFEIDKTRDCFNLPHCHALRRRPTVDAGLDREQLRYPLQRLLGERRAGCD